MKTNLERIEHEIDNVLEMSSICRSEWCRTVESDVDRLDEELREANLEAYSLNDDERIEVMSGKIRQAYKNLGPDIHI